LPWSLFVKVLRVIEALTVLKWDEERSLNLLRCLLEFIHEDDAALAVVAG
jgi:hypothetical protein